MYLSVSARTHTHTQWAAKTVLSWVSVHTLDSPSSCCRCLSDWFCLSCLANKKLCVRTSSLWLSLSPSLSMSLALPAECVRLLCCQAALIRLCLFVDQWSGDRWLAWHVLRGVQREMWICGCGGCVSSQTATRSSMERCGNSYSIGLKIKLWRAIHLLRPLKTTFYNRNEAPANYATRTPLYI